MLKCVAIDDDPNAVSIIQDFCDRRGDIAFRGFTSPVTGMDFIHESMPDIVFIDIDMNSRNGLELARKLPEATCLIFTSVNSDYAIDGYNADAVDFLQKPVFYPRFERALYKARVWLDGHARNDLLRESITLKVEHKKVVVNLADITFIEAMDNYAKIFRHRLPMIMSQITLKDMEALLPPHRFLRVHRSFIVALGAIERFSNRQIFIRNLDRPIPVGRKYTETFNNLQNILYAPKS